MKFISQKQPWKKIVLAVLTTAVVAPLATPSAQAAPPDYAPAYGYRNKDDKKADKAERKAAKKAKKVIRDRDSDGYDDRDKDRDGDLDEEDGYDYRETPRYQKQYGDNEYSNDNSRDFRDNNRNGIEDRYESEYRNGRSTTLTGVIVRDLPGNRFEIRTSNNRTYRVMTRSNEPLRLTRGDQVSISGRIVGNNRIIIADRVRITRNDDQNQNGSRVEFTARVQDVRSQRELIVRTSDGRTLRVRTSFDLSSRIDDGDRVRIVGRLQNNVVDASRVDLSNNSNNDDDFGNDDNNGNNIDFKGRVESSRSFLGQRIITVRADNGTTYRVRSTDNQRFDNGDRIRVRGDLRSGIVFANDIDRI